MGADSDEIQKIHSFKRAFFWTVLVLLVFIFLEGAALLGLVLLDRWKGIVYEPEYLVLTNRQHASLNTFLNNPRFYMQPDPLLGWTMKRNWSSEDGLDWTNGQGLRADREYAPLPESDKVRIATFGDSFTYGSEVHNDETWQEALEALEPTWEVLNFGVPASGLDQAYLRYRQTKSSFHSDIVLIGFFLENIRRSVNTFRPFLKSTASVMAKPRFVLQKGELTLIPTPLPTRESYEAFGKDPCDTLKHLAEYDWFVTATSCESSFDLLPSVRLFEVIQQSFRPPEKKETGYKHAVHYEVDAEAFQVTTAIFDAFVDEVRSNGSKPLILFFPARSDLDWEGSFGSKPHATLLAFLKERQYSYIDFIDVFPKHLNGGSFNQFFARQTFGHYSARGNDIVAKGLIQELQSQEWGSL